MSAADVLVVGAGGAGLAAAVAAAEDGARVVVLEQRAEPGGKTAIAIGSLTAAATAPQRRVGIEDSRDEHRADLLAMLRARRRDTAGDPSPRIVVDDGPQLVDWLEGHGVRFGGPHPERAHRAYRLHCAQPDGSAYPRALGAAARDLGVGIECDARVVALERAGDGARGAATARGADGRAGDLVARLADGRSVRGAAVVLAAGDHSGDLARFDPPRAARVPALAEWDRGDAQTFASGLGAALDGMRRPVHGALRFAEPPFTEPDPLLLARGAVLVDERGRRPHAAPGDPRFFELTASGRWFLLLAGELASELAEPSSDGPDARDGWLRTGRAAICTAPGRGYDYLDDVLARRGCAHAGSLPELAARAGIDAGGLQATVAATNSRRERADDPRPMRRAPFIALGPLRSRIMLAHGGVRVDERMRALDGERRPVAGLYAAGNAAAWFGYAGGHGYGLAWALASGRRAGRAAAGAG